MRRRVALSAAALVVVSLMAAGPAYAQYTGGTPPPAGPVVKPVAVAPAAPTPAKVRVDGAPAARTRTFALTGADIAQMVLVGGAFVVGGLLLVRYGRRRVASAS